MTTHSQPLPYYRSFDNSTVAEITPEHHQVLHNTPIEHTIVFNRPGEEVNLSVQHFDGNYEVHLVTFNMECGEPTTIHEEKHLSYQEARLLRDLFLRPEVAQWLEQDFQ